MAYNDENVAKLLRQNKRCMRELNRLESVFNAIKEGVIIVESDGNLRYANRAAKDIFAISRESGRNNILKIIPELTTCSIDVPDHGLAMSREFEITYPERRYIRVYSSPFDGDQDDSIIMIVSDITKEKSTTEELIENEKIVSVLKLASGVAHEIGNPLNSISIHLQLAKRRILKLPKSPDCEKISESLDICTKEIDRLDIIIKNFLKALRPVRPDLHEIAPISPLLESLKLFENELKNIGIKVTFQLSPTLPSMMGDKNLLKQLYFNIIKNSMEAMDGGGLIKIAADFNDNDIEISISDTGCGIDEAAFMHIFEPYFTTKTDGHGLGMMIASEIVKAHGGRIAIKSKKGYGTTTILTFPRKQKRIRVLSDG